MKTSSIEQSITWNRLIRLLFFLLFFVFYLYLMPACRTAVTGSDHSGPGNNKSGNFIVPNSEAQNVGAFLSENTPGRRQ